MKVNYSEKVLRKLEGYRGFFITAGGTIENPLIYYSNPDAIQQPEVPKGVVTNIAGIKVLILNTGATPMMGTDDFIVPVEIESVNIGNFVSYQ